MQKTDVSAEAPQEQESPEKKSIVETMAYLQERSQNIERCSDKLRDEVEKFNKHFSDSIGKVAGVEIELPGYLQKNPQEFPVYFAVACRHGFCGFAVGYEYFPMNPKQFKNWVEEGSRDELVYFVRHLPAFLTVYRKAVDKADGEISEVAQQIEKIVSSL